MESKAQTNTNNFIKDALVLCVITLVAGALLGLVNEITAPMIEKAALQAKLSAYEEVFADAAEFVENASLTELVASDTYANALSLAGVEKAAVKEAYEAVDGSGNRIGYVMTTDSSAGYGGQISIGVGMKTDGTVVGMQFLVLNETSGLGSEADKPDFKNQFKNQGADGFQLGGNIDAMSGATVTSKAVTNAMNAAVVLVQQAAE